MEGIKVVDEPLIVIPVPEKVCVVFCAVKVVALFVRLLAKENVAAAPVVVSFQTAPLLRVTAPLKVMVRAVVLEEPKLIVPLIEVAPITIIDLYIVTVPPGFIVSAPKIKVPPEVVSVAPLFTVTDPAAVWLMLAPMVTALAPVVAMITASPTPGTTPPTQVDAVAHVPPVVVDVIVAAKTLAEKKLNNKIMTKTE